jgi:[CysO sulfur-carrier protein]-S-L-cysteine hydrolase
VSAPVRIEGHIFDAVVAHACSDPGQERCGLLGGREGVITRVFPAANAARNPATRYEISPREIVDRMREMREAGIDLLGIYHSHPNGRNEPSPHDVELAFYPETPYLIVSPLPGAPRPIRAFLIRDGQVSEVEIHVV